MILFKAYVLQHVIVIIILNICFKYYFVYKNITQESGLSYGLCSVQRYAGRLVFCLYSKSLTTCVAEIRAQSVCVGGAQK